MRGSVIESTVSFPWGMYGAIGLVISITSS